LRLLAKDHALLSLLFVFCNCALSSLLFFLLLVYLLSSSLVYIRITLTLLLLLIYLGGFIVLLSYFWMLLPLSFLSHFPYPILVSFLFISLFRPFSASGRTFLLLDSTGLLLLFGCLLMLSMVVVVLVVDLSEGSFL